MILVISDVHLGYDGCNKEDFLAFLEGYQNTEIDHFVILGDLFDFWRRKNLEIITENKDILEKLTNLKAENIHYVVGNHDYYMLKLNERYENNFPFEVKKFLRLEDGGKKFYFIHGYEFEVLNLEPMTLEEYEGFSEAMCFNEDIVGGIEGDGWDLAQKTKSEVKGLFDGIKKAFVHIESFKEQMKENPRDRLKSLDETKKIYNLATSQSKYFLLGMKPDEILIFGHTHGPFINDENTVANTGSWVNELKQKEYQNSYIEINNGEMELKFWPKG